MPVSRFDNWAKGTAALSRRKREVLVLRQNGIRVRFNEINLVSRRQPQIDACVAVDSEQTVDAFARLLDMGDERWVEPLGELIFQAPAFTIFLIPFRLVSRNLLFVRRNFPADHLADRKHG